MMVDKTYVLIFVGFLLLAGTLYCLPGFTISKTTITVREKYVYTKIESDGKHNTWSTLYYVVVTTDGITYGVQYLPWEIFRNSQVLYGNIQVGQTYHVKIWGWRIEWLGIFNNVCDLGLIYL